jgi:hypothetical protein
MYPVRIVQETILQTHGNNPDRVNQRGGPAGKQDPPELLAGSQLPGGNSWFCRVAMDRGIHPPRPALPGVFAT